MALSRLIKRLRWRKKIAASGVVSQLYEQTAWPSKTPFSELKILAVDCEMTGLNPKQDELLSIGWVAIQNGFIDYSSGKHVLCHASEDVGESVTIHGLSDRQIAGASSVSQALSLLIKDLSDSVAVFHHAHLDLEFLQAAARSTFGCPLSFQYIDTMAIEKRRLDRQGRTGSLQLGLCRDRYGLPHSHAHNALSDAIATAELLIAQASALSGLQTTYGSLGSRWA
jgi:DNA polymerase-3 subunit epsilon